MRVLPRASLIALVGVEVALVSVKLFLSASLNIFVRSLAVRPIPASSTNAPVILQSPRSARAPQCATGRARALHRAWAVGLRCRAAIRRSRQSLPGSGRARMRNSCRILQNSAAAGDSPACSMDERRRCRAQGGRAAMRTGHWSAAGASPAPARAPGRPRSLTPMFPNRDETCTRTPRRA